MFSSAPPLQEPTKLPLSSYANSFVFANSVESIKNLSSVSYKPYSSLGFTQIASLAGRVHGVVVQMTAKTPLLILQSKISSTSLVLIHLNDTSTAIDFLSSYSTSASASAELQSVHQLTGLPP